MRSPVLFSLLVAVASFAAPNTGLKPVWEDNFDGKEIDLKKWNVGGAAKIVDGKLSLEITPAAGGKPGFWDGSSVNSAGKFEHPQGYFEASIRMLQTKGRWAGFSARNADMGKIPAASLEFISTGADKIDPVLTFADESGSHRLAPKTSPIAMEGGASYKKFHTYGLQWTAKAYIFYVDGRPMQRMERPSAKNPMHLAFFHNLPEGGLLKDFMNPKMGPEPLQIDWVKVFKIP